MWKRNDKCGGKVVDYIIVNISKSLYSDDNDYGLYHVREVNTTKGWVCDCRKQK